MIGILMSFLYADWRGARSARGPFGIVTEAMNSLLTLNVWRVIIYKHDWPAHRIRKTVNDAAARKHQRPPKIWGFYTHGDERIFYVPIRQAAWTVDILKRAGASYLHRTDIVPKYGHQSPEFQNAINRRKTRMKRARR